jgi:Tfp pilus assembly protein FimT
MEAMVAMSLAGVVSAVSVPFANGYFSQYQLTRATSEVAFDLSRSRMQAVGQNALVRVRFTDSTHYVRERSTDNGTTYTQDGGTMSLPTGISATTLPTTTFTRTGFPVAATTITLKSAKDSKSISVNSVGRVKVS